MRVWTGFTEVKESDEEEDDDSAWNGWIWE